MKYFVYDAIVPWTWSRNSRGLLAVIKSCTLATWVWCLSQAGSRSLTQAGSRSRILKERRSFSAPSLDRQFWYV